MARAEPIARVSRCVPPAPGMTPIRISGWPNRASSPATIRSHDIASSQPPPRAKPRTAAMSGTPIAQIRSQASNRPLGRQPLRGLVGELEDVGTGSERPVAGAGQDDGPGPPSRVERLERVPASSSSRSKLSALSASGRSRVTSATPVMAGGAGLDAQVAGGRLDVGNAAALPAARPDQYPRSGNRPVPVRTRPAWSGGRAAAGRRSRSGRPRARAASSRPGAISRRFRPAGAHRVGGEPGIERRAVVEVHRGGQHEVGLAAERLVDAPDRASRAGRASRRRAAGARRRSGARIRRGPPAPPSGRRNRASSVVIGRPPSVMRHARPGASDGFGRSVEARRAPRRAGPVVLARASWPTSGRTSSRPSRTWRARASACATGTNGSRSPTATSVGASIARSWAGVSSGWVATSSTIGRQQPRQAPAALDGVVAGRQWARPDRVVALDPLRIHQPAGDR